MAKYRLNLNKTKMYQLISEYRTDLPKMCRCEFSHCGSSFWMEYVPTNENYDCIRVTVMVCMGTVSIRIVGMNIDHVEELYMHDLSLGYLQDSGLLKEVA